MKNFPNVVEAVLNNETKVMDLLSFVDSAFPVIKRYFGRDDDRPSASSSSSTTTAPPISRPIQRSSSLTSLLSISGRFSESSRFDEREMVDDRSRKGKKVLDFVIPTCFRGLNLEKSEAASGYTPRLPVTTRAPPYRSAAQYPVYSELELSLSSHLNDQIGRHVVVAFAVDDEKTVELGRTEVVSDPNSNDRISVFFQFESIQTLLFRFFQVKDTYLNVPAKKLELTKLTYVGEANCILSQVLTTPGRLVTLQVLAESTHVGTLSVQAKEKDASKAVVYMTLGCANLHCASDHLLRISRLVRDDSTTIAVPLYATEVVNNSANPIWKRIRLTLQHFQTKETKLLVECIRYSTNHRFGFTVKSLSELESLFHEGKAAMFLYPPSIHSPQKCLKGQLNVDAFEEKSEVSFLDHISSGYRFSYMVAVDFSAYNGDYRIASSLHHESPSSGLNPYQEAILGVGEVLQFYDSDDDYPAWGFGRVNADGTESHSFELTRERDDESSGLEGIMSAYASTRPGVVPAEAVRFGDVIEKAIETASQARALKARKYFVLQIITGGKVCSDIAETVEALVRASTLPLSVLFVGVGNASFAPIERALQADVRSVTTRDMVQFLPVQEGGQVELTQALFALPDQFVSYVRSLSPPEI